MAVFLILLLAERKKPEGPDRFSGGALGLGWMTVFGVRSYPAFAFETPPMAEMVIAPTAVFAAALPIFPTTDLVQRVGSMRTFTS
jgi:hypothetical protein